MRVLVVYCHPVPESYCSALRDTVLVALQPRHEVRLVDLYAEGFNPVMGCEERRRYNDLPPEQHALQEHLAHLRWAEGIVFVYPTWWYGLPAMLKGWLDRAWAPGVVFEIAEGGMIRPLMRHVRKLAVVTTCGAPRWWSYVVGHPGKRTLLRGLRANCARTCRTAFMAHYLMDVSTEESRGRFLKHVRRRMDKF